MTLFPRPLVGLAVSAHNTGAISTATFSNYSISSTPTFGLSDADIGTPGIAGSDSLAGSTITVSGGGADIYGTSDHFNFASQNFTGNGSIIAEVTSQTNTSPSAKAGVMFRNDATAGSVFADVVITPSNGVNFQSRSTAGGSSTSSAVTGIAAPVFVKLTRTGSSFTAFYSTDGVTWTQIGSARTLTMGTTALAGLAVSAVNNAKLSTATFTNFSVAGAASSPPALTSDGTHRPLTVNTLDNLGEATASSQYDGDTIALTDTNADGVPDSLDATKLVAYSTAAYDEQGRAYQTKVFSVDPTSGTVSSTALTSNSFFDHRGDEIESVSPSGLASKSSFDGAGRQVESYTTDSGVLSGASQNWTNAGTVSNDVVLSQTDMTYDADGNLILSADHERLPSDPQTGSASTGALSDASGSTGPAANVYFAGQYFDAADRQIASVNVGTNGGSAYTLPSSVPTRSDTVLVNSTTYNSAGWVDTTTDPRGIVAKTNYDALGRTTNTIADYTGGSPTASSNQTTNFTFDGDNHVLSQTAVQPTGTPSQTTDYIYGVTTTGSNLFSNDLLAKVEYPNATTGAASTSATDDVAYTYDALGEMTGMTDQNGSTHAYSHDSLGRQTLDSVSTLGSGVDGTIRAIGMNFNSQGLPFQETSYSNASATTVVNQDQDVYNGLGQLTGEYQAHSGAVNISTTPEVQYSYSSLGLSSRMTSMTYPNGRVVNDAYNTGIDTTIGRVSAIADATGSAAGTDQSYTYQGLSTIVGEGDGNGVAETTTLDSFGRSAELNYVNTSTSASTDDFQYGYDRDGNALYKNNILNSAESELYHANSAASGDNNAAYDSLNRLTGFARGTLSSSGNNGSGLDTVTSASASQSWNLDAVGNQSSVTSNGTTTTNASNAKNELTTNGTHSLVFDHNGNTTTDENGQSYTYDAWNRSVTVKNSGGTTIAVFGYDLQNRRITETAGGTTTDVYFTPQWQAIEERQGSTVTRQNVWGLSYVNQLIERDDNSTSGGLGISGSGLGRRLYTQQDANWNVTSLVDASGNVVQRMVYVPYGAVTFLTAGWSSTTDVYAQNYLFQDGRLETATGNYIFDARDYGPATGTWREADPAGYINGPDVNQMELSNPVALSDPSGLGPPGLAHKGENWQPLLNEMDQAGQEVSAVGASTGGGAVAGAVVGELGGPGGALAGALAGGGYGLINGIVNDVIYGNTNVTSNLNSGLSAGLIGTAATPPTLPGGAPNSVAAPTEEQGGTNEGATNAPSGSPNSKDSAGTAVSIPSSGDLTLTQPVCPTAAAKGAPKSSPNFQPPTNAPQLPPTDIPPDWRVRQMPPTEQYPNGYWRLEKPMTNGGWQGIDPSTMKPGTQPQTHVPLPPPSGGQ